MTKNVLDEKTPPKIEEIKIEEDFHTKYMRERKEKADNFPKKAERFKKNKTKVLSKLTAKKFPQFSNKKIEACLAMNKETNWKWAWCVVDCASHQYLGELSQRFDYSAQADDWIEEQIKCMASI